MNDRGSHVLIAWSHLKVNSKTFHFFLYMDAFPFVITGISIPLLLFTVCGNFLVFVVITKNKKLQNANTCLISNLAFSDFGFGIVTFLDIIFISNSVPHSSFEFLAKLWLQFIFSFHWQWSVILPFWNHLCIWNERAHLWYGKSLWQYGFWWAFWALEGIRKLLILKDHSIVVKVLRWMQKAAYSTRTQQQRLLLGSKFLA